MNKREVGAIGEETAIKALKKRGYKILERNHTTRFGEIDIIAEEGGYLVFVEVKKRNTDQFGDALSAVTRVKQQHMVKSALWYMKKHKCFDRHVRFDAVGLDGEQVKIVKSAFMVEDDRR
ncbi:MAG TPA: YraN family protein [Syntrophorhabdales bacterium]|nr:YraN family protein [Syntrophorhabdales bacterium]